MAVDVFVRIHVLDEAFDEDAAEDWVLNHVVVSEDGTVVSVEEVRACPPEGAVTLSMTADEVEELLHN